MPFVKKRTPGEAFGWQWIDSEDIVELDEEQARALLDAPNSDFFEVPCPSIFSEVVNETPLPNRPVQRK